MKWSKNMEWARPYVECAQSLFPYERITAIKGYTARLGQVAHQDAGITRAGNGRFTINIRLTNPDGQAERLEDLLVALAHELAHTAVWPHTPRHLIITADILSVMASHAYLDGVKDTQKRLKISRPKKSRT